MKKGLILAVDDEPYILQTMKAMFRRDFKDYYLEFATSGDEALGILQNYLDKEINVSVIISDFLMPGMKGDEFLSKANKLSPGSAKFLLSGMINKETTDGLIEEAGITKVIHKPWENKELLDDVKKAVGVA